MYGENQYRKARKEDIDLGMLVSSYFYIKKMNILKQSWECEVLQTVIYRLRESCETQRGQNDGPLSRKRG